MNQLMHLLILILTLISGKDNAPPACTPIPYAYDASNDYRGGNPGEWVEEGGDGALIGYALYEDSNIYPTIECALLAPTYSE